MDCACCGGALELRRGQLTYCGRDRWGAVYDATFFICTNCGAGQVPAAQFIGPFKEEVLRKEYDFKAGDRSLAVHG